MEQTGELEHMNPINDTMTGEEACKFISKKLKEVEGIDIEPQAIWDMSPTGELSHVFYLYQWAKKH